MEKDKNALPGSTDNKINSNSVNIVNSILTNQKQNSLDDDEEYDPFIPNNYEKVFEFNKI